MKRIAGKSLLIAAVTLVLLVGIAFGYPPGYTLGTSGTGTAELSQDYSITSPNSVKLATVTTTDKGEIKFNPDSTLSTITALNYWTYTVQGGTYDQLTAWISIYLHTLPGKTIDDWFTDYYASSPNVFYIQAEPYYPYADYYSVPDISATFNTWVKWDAFDPTIPLTWQSLESTGSEHGAPTLAAYIAGAIPPYSSREYGSLYICGIKIRMGYGGPWANTLAYVDNVQINEYLETFDPAAPVGGVWTPINKLELLAPYIGLASMIAVATISIVYVKHRKKKQT